MYRAARGPRHKRTGVAVLGAGYWGKNYLRLLGELPDAKLVAVCDASEERLDEVARRFPGVALTTDVDELLEIKRVEAVVVATQATTHRDVAGRALEAGKHVLVEKPITTTVSDADELIELAESRGVVLAVGHTFLFNSGIRKLKELLESGDIGPLHYLYSRRTSLGPIRHDVDAIWDLAAHDISIFNYLLDGIPDWASAVGARVLKTERNDVGFVALSYGPVLAHVHVSWADPHKVRETVLVGSERRVVFNDLDVIEPVRVFEKGVTPIVSDGSSSFAAFQFQLRDGDIRSPRIAGVEPLRHTCGHFLHCIRRGEAPLADGRTGRDVVAVIEAIERSLAFSGMPMQVPAGVPFPDLTAGLAVGALPPLVSS